MKDNPQIWKNFIVLEGLDGSGTTTQLKRLESAAVSRGIPFHATWEPTDNPVGRLIRRVLRKEDHVTPETLARLFTTDRFEHLYAPETGIKARVEKGEMVISDRYIFSSLAYQSLGCGFDKVLELNDFPLPEKLLFIDVPWEVCRERRHLRDMEELFEGAPIQHKISDNYEKALGLFADSGMEIHRIDGTGTEDEVFDAIAALLFHD
jgi:dTMP kinase